MYELGSSEKCLFTHRVPTQKAFQDLVLPPEYKQKHASWRTYCWKCTPGAWKECAWATLPKPEVAKKGKLCRKCNSVNGWGRLTRRACLPVLIGSQKSRRSERGGFFKKLREPKNKDMGCLVAKW